MPTDNPADNDGNDRPATEKLISAGPGAVLRRRVFDASSAAKEENDRSKARGTKGPKNGGRQRKRRPGGRANPRPPAPGQAPRGATPEVEEEVYVHTWWGKRWIEAIESVSTAYANRLPRGMAYAKNGHVRNLKVNPGKVEAAVSGRRAQPYKVSIQLRTMTASQWKKIIDMLGNRAAFTASLLAGEMPERLTDVFEQCGLSLFPRRIRELKTTCSCPDWANPCKHIAATHYVLGTALDEDPFLLLALRGKRREEILSALRAARSGDDVEEPGGTAAATKDHLGISVGQLEATTFYVANDDLSDFRFHIALPDLPMSVLRRLGDPPVWDGGGSLQVYLAGLYTRTAELAEQLGLRDVSEETPRPARPVQVEEFDDEESDELDEEFVEEPRRTALPPGAIALPTLVESEVAEPGEVEPRPAVSEGPTVLVRRAGRTGDGGRGDKQAKKAPEPEPPPRQRTSPGEKREARRKVVVRTPPEPVEAVPRLSRRVVPGTNESGAAPTLEDRLEMVLPITEAMPDGPQIARQIIWALKTHGPATARQLARRTRMKKVAVLQLLQSLLTVGLVSQEGQGERARFAVPAP